MIITEYVDEIINCRFETGETIPKPGMRKFLYGFHPNAGHGSLGDEFANKYYDAVEIQEHLAKFMFKEQEKENDCTKSRPV